MKHRDRRLGAIVLALSLICGTSATAQDWPQWRGPNRDNKVAGFVEPKMWPRELTKKWKVTVGIGEASPVLVGDKLYTFGRQDKDEVTLCLDAATGKEIWKDKNSAAAITGPASGYPGPRSTLAAGEGKVCTLGVHGVVTCFDADTGKIVWRKETGKAPTYFTASSPIIADGKCIVFAGGLTAFDLKSGDAKWTWSGAGAPYGSPVIATIDGVKQVIAPAQETLVGIDFADGKLLWKVALPAGYQSNYSTPMVDGSIVYYSVAGGGKKGGTGGMSATKIEKKGTEFLATEVWRNGFSADKYHSPVLKDGLIFGVTAMGKNFYCLDAKTGNQLWKDGTARGDCGSILNAGTVMLALTSDKDLIAFRPDAKSYMEVTKYRVSDSPTWCVPIVAGNRIYVKDKGGSLTLWTME